MFLHGTVRQMGERMEKEKSIFNVKKIFKVFCIIVAVLVIGAVVVFAVKLQIDGRDALREAKNVRLALRSADIEMYAKSMSIYNPQKKNGIEAGVKGKVEQIYAPEGTYAITSYDKSKHELTGMTYRKGHYIVTFVKTDERIVWDVDYLLNIYRYDDFDVKLEDE